MYSQLWICPLQIARLHKICNSVNVASATANMFCTAVSVVSYLISHYTGLLIGGSNLTCLVKYNISALIPWCRLSIWVANPLFSLLTLILLINLSTIKSWSSPMETFDIAISNSWIPKSYLYCIVGGAHGSLISTIPMYLWKFELVLYYSSIEEIPKILWWIPIKSIW